MNRGSMLPARKPTGERDHVPWGEVAVDEPLVVAGKAIGGVTAAGNALSVVFNQCSVILESPDGPLSQTCVGSLTVPVTPAEGSALAGISLTVRGSIIKSAGTRAVLFTDAGGQQRVVEFPFGQQTSRLLEVGQMLSLTPALLEGETQCAISLLLLAQRLSADEHVMLAVDTLDAVALFDPAVSTPLQ
jgi:hypothetical protein